MKPIVPVLIGAAALLALGAAGGGGGATQAGFEPQRVPSVPPNKPPTPEGDARNNDEGRTWGTFYVNRNERKHYEMRVLSVASSPSVAAIGTGDVIVDVYETIVANADWEWHGQVCGGTRWKLRFESGRLMSFVIVGPRPCATMRPTTDIWSRGMTWTQSGESILLVLDTNSGLNHRSPDRMVVPPKKVGKFGGTGAYGDDRDNPQWYNGNVSSGYITLDASWIFNPKA